jgi:recombination protein RecA
MYGKGISREGALLDLAVEMAIAKKSGAWFTYEGEQLGQGRENAKNYLHDHPELMMDMEQKIRTQAGLNGAEEEVFTEKDEAPIELD